MAWTVVLHWQIVVSLLLPLAMAFVLAIVEAHGPLSDTIRKTTGIVPPYVAAITVIFGLFATRLVTDVWEKDTSARRSTQVEDDALRGLLHFANAGGVRDVVLPPLKAYAKAASEENPFSSANRTARDTTERAFEALVSTVASTPLKDAAMRASLLGTVGELRQARDRRLYIADDETAFMKWFSLLFLGVLTQVTIVLVHVGNTRAMRTALGIFTIAFTFCVVIIAVFDQPFEILLADEPGATLAHIKMLE